MSFIAEPRHTITYLPWLWNGNPFLNSNNYVHEQTSIDAANRQVPDFGSQHPIFQLNAICIEVEDKSLQVDKTANLNGRSIWKEAHINDACIKGDASLHSNYHPISLINTTEKVSERLIYNHLLNHIRDIQFLSSAQWGFIPGKPTYVHIRYTLESSRWWSWGENCLLRYK